MIDIFTRIPLHIDWDKKEMKDGKKKKYIR
jgi:hypothetical protein